MDSNSAYGWKQSLREFLRGMSRDEQTVFAHRAGTTFGSMKQMVYGSRPCNPEVAVAFDRESGGLVSMQEMAPGVDWEYVASALQKRPRAPSKTARRMKGARTPESHQDGGV